MSGIISSAGSNSGVIGFPAPAKVYTLTLSGGNLTSTTYAKGELRQSIDGTWVLSFAIRWNTSSSAAPGTSISGISLAETQAISGTQTDGTTDYNAWGYISSGGAMSHYFPSSKSGNVMLDSGTIILNAKPTWAD